SLLDSIKDTALDSKVLDKESLSVAISQTLNRREKRIIYLRFYDNLSQSEIAELLNISQMHVSRLLNRSLEKLKKHLKK
ncbi:MAG: hypothetical protein OMM_13079, partial [Candidatus Magnetoglobus multicellularis str. Araruama]